MKLKSNGSKRHIRVVMGENERHVKRDMKSNGNDRDRRVSCTR